MGDNTALGAAMTVIAWDGKTLAADKRACYGSLINTVTKIHRIDGMLVGCSGDLTFALAMIEWVRRGRKADDFPASQGTKDDWQPLLVIEPDRSILLYERTPYPIRYEQLHCAMGSGREIARTAMYCGKTAREAVEVACALDSGCGNGIDTLELCLDEARSKA